jgi:hypothetical protein
MSEMTTENSIWVFTTPRRPFPGGVFVHLEAAEAWICANRLTGVLTAYPLDRGVFDWAVEHGLTNLRPDKLEAARANPNPEFIGGFTTASQEHYHYENGERLC